MKEKLAEKAKQLAMEPTACNWFQYFAQETWDRISFARSRRGTKIWETTITQNLIFEFQLSKDLYNHLPPTTWAIDIKEAVNEATNGNDIELFVETSDGILFFAIQAKIIYHSGFKRDGMVNGDYPQMDHTNGNGHQIELLCDYASDKGGIPLYLLYNWVNNSLPKETKCEIEYGIEQFGCSIVNALNIKSNYFNQGNWTIPTFNDLHPDEALPWFIIPCCFINNTKTEVLKMLNTNLDELGELRTYDLNDLLSDPDWKSVQPFSNFEGSNENYLEPNSFKFKPRYRVVISKSLSQVKKRSF